MVWKQKAKTNQNWGDNILKYLFKTWICKFFQQNFNLKVILPGFKEESQILKIRLLPGNIILRNIPNIYLLNNILIIMYNDAFKGEVLWYKPWKHIWMSNIELTEMTK